MDGDGVVSFRREPGAPSDVAQTVAVAELVMSTEDLTAFAGDALKDGLDTGNGESTLTLVANFASVLGAPADGVLVEEDLEPRVPVPDLRAELLEVPAAGVPPPPAPALQPQGDAEPTPAGPVKRETDRPKFGPNFGIAGSGAAAFAPPCLVPGWPKNLASARPGSLEAGHRS